jgi:hypothetical protein
VTAAAGGERGGAAILVAFMLLTLMAAAAFGTSRNLTRELAIAGDAQRGDEAAAAAEAGLEWFLAWSAGAAFRPFLAGLEAGPAGEEWPLPGVPAEWPPETPAAAVRQSFQLRIRRLGALPRPGPEADPALDQLWQVTATGRCVVKGQGERGFTQVRELLFTAPPVDPGGPEADPGDARRGVRVQAWR